MISDIGEIVTGLLQLRSILADPIPHDQISETFDVCAAQHDIQHVKEKLPKASKEMISRLGRANWRRRHYLIGLQNLRQPETSCYGGLLKESSFVKDLRLSGKGSEEESSGGEAAWFADEEPSTDDPEDGQSSVEWSRDSWSSNTPSFTNPTTISSVKGVISKKPTPKAMPLTGHLPIEQVTDGAQSSTSPPLGPTMLLTGKPFRCSYCGLELINYKRDKQWR